MTFKENISFIKLEGSLSHNGQCDELHSLYT